MLDKDAISLLQLSRTPEQPPAAAAHIALVESMVGRPLPEDLRHFWSIQNGYAGEVYDLSGVYPNNNLISDTIGDLECFVVWKTVGWIPVGHDDFGNFFLSIPTSAGDVVGFVDIGFDPPTTVLCAVGSSINQFIKNLITLDHCEEVNASEPCDIGRNDPLIDRASILISKWIKKE